MKVEFLIILVVIVVITVFVLLKRRDVPRYEISECRDFVTLDQLCGLPLNIYRACGDMVFVGTQSAFDKCGPSNNCKSSGKTIYAISGSQLSRIDSQTQVSTVLGNTNIELFDIAFGADGILYGINPNGTQLYTLNLTTGNATLFGNLSTNLAENALATGPDGYLYGIFNNELRRCKPPSLVVTTIRSGLPRTLGDISFLGKDMYWSSEVTGVFSIRKITGPNLVTGPVTVVGPCDSGLWGLAHVNCELWGSIGFQLFKVSTLNATTSSLFTVPTFGTLGITGMATRDEAMVNSGSYPINITSLRASCLPMSFTTNQNLFITINDPSLTTQIVLLAGGSFTITTGYVVTALVNGWINV